MTTAGEDLIEAVPKWQTAGRRMALATVLRTWGGSPRAVGSHLLVDQNGVFEGSVSGGCIESAVIHESAEVIAGGTPKTLQYSIGNERAWEVGLSCGGKVEVYLEAVTTDHFWTQLLQAKSEKRRVARLLRMSDGAQFLIDESGATALPAMSETQAAKLTIMFNQDMSGYLSEADEWFLCSYPPRARLLVVGGVHIAQALIPMAEMAGFAATLIDPRAAFGSKARFPNTRIVNQWPEEAFGELGLDRATYVVTLTHDTKLDDPALAAALRSPARYIGALGSRRTHDKRLARLRKMGFDEELSRIHGPVGLKLGGRKPAQIAVAVLAEMIQTTYTNEG